MWKRAFLAAAFLFAPITASAQDLYDINVLRTVNLQFHAVNWWTLLQQNYASQTNILADLTIEGVTYPSVGVRIRGNTSYTALPAGSQKVSLNIETDFVNADQTVLGYKNLNFNNSFHDPTFCREVVYMNILNRWIPCGRANHINLTLNGANWGVYANVQQYDKTLLKEFFADEDGLRVKCANNPSGPGLQYFGTNPSSYAVYEIKEAGEYASPVQRIIQICAAIDNTPAANWQTIDQTFAIDPSSWTVVFENLFSDDDSYVNKGCDFVFYENPIDHRTHLHQADGNETFTNSSWSATQSFTSTTKPVLNNVLASTEMRGRYFAHLRAALAAELDWAVLGPEFTARRNLIDAAVQADPKKLYSYTLFVNNFTSTVNLGGSPPFGGSLIGLQQYVTQRRSNLLANAEVAAVGPTITNLAHSSNTPGASIYITANVSAPTALASVHLYYQPSPAGPFSRTLMTDNGTTNDGAAGDGKYGALLPVTGVGGQTVCYYVGATATGAFSPQAFEPVRSELDPRVIVFPGGTANSDVVINEFLAQNNATIQDPFGAFEDYVELYNKGASTVDLSGKYMSDTLANPTKWQFPAGVTIAPGQTLLIWADEDVTEGPTHADFKLSAGGEEIGFWDTDGTTLLDSVIFGAQQANVSTGLLHDGGTLMVTIAPTPGTLNDAGCGLRTYDQLSPFAHTLDLAATGSGAIGTGVTFTASGLLPNSTAYFALDFFPTHIPVSTTLVALMTGSIVVPMPASPAGTLSVPLFIPNDSGLIDLDVYFQTAGFNASSVFTASNALHLSICP